ncbi:major facilitator superfamily domain-containing protein [Dichotomocladium elegans]|nr:major facilitator superfamily domain-containing protein [Dichotomocladium elegans]
MIPSWISFELFSLTTQLFHAPSPLLNHMNKESGPLQKFMDKCASPLVQVIFVGLVCLCCPGMFNALSGIGAGGLMGSDVYLTNTANSVLYVFFAVVGFFGGSFCNKFGPRLTLTVGSVGYVIYSASLWVYDTKENRGFVIAAGAILGCCAGLLWTAQGSIMMSYPEEKNKGKYVAVFWAIFNVGGILGSLITLGLNLQNHTGKVATGTYVAFIVIMGLGIVLTFLLVSPSRVVRHDGTKVLVHEAASWSTEIMNVIRVVKDWRMLCLAPAFLCSNWFYAYQFHMNAVYFDAGTRALNSAMYWTFQIVGSLGIGLLLDYTGLSRRARALVTGAFLFVIIIAVWIGGFIFQLGFEADFKDTKHWTSPGFGGPFVLYLCYGLTDAMYQTYMYWLMGSMSNDSTVLSRYAGFYKAVQSAGAALSFGIDTGAVRLRWAALIAWLLLIVSFPGIFAVANKVPPTLISEEDMVATDEKKEVETDEKKEVETPV